MKQSTFSAQVANKLLTVLQGYTKGIRFVAVLTVLLTMGIGQMWGATYNFSNIPTSGWSTSGGKQTINNKSWTYSSSTYIGCSDKAKIQVGSSKNPQTTDWTIQIPISSFGANIKVTKVAITAYTTATTATYDISVSGSSVKSGNLTTSSNTYSSSTLNATTGNIVVTLKGSSNSKAMYLSNIAVTYETVAATTYTVTYDDNGATSGTVPIDDTEYNSGATVTVKLNSGSLAKTGYTFSGWNTKEDGTGTTYTAGTGTFIISTNTILYAKWTANTYTVTWIANGETKRTDIGVAYNTSKTAPTVSPIPCGDVIAGWTDATDGNYVHGTSILYSGATPSIQITDNKTFYAVFADYEQ